MPLNLRDPDCTIAPPVVVIGGEDGVGKSTALALLSASKRIGLMAWLQLGETIADEYGRWPGANYKIIIHDGTWGGIFDQVAEAHAEAARRAAAGELPLALAIDGMTAEWDMIRDWIDKRNASSRKNKALLAEDPHAELPKAGRNLWNEGNLRHHQLMRLLTTFAGPVVMTARAGEISMTDPATGQPVAGKGGRPAPKEWRLETQRDLRHQATMVIRLQRDDVPSIISCKSTIPGVGIQAGVDQPVALPRDWTLENLIFNVLKYDPKTGGARELITLTTDRSPEEIRDEAVHPGTSYERLGELFHEADRLHYDNILLQNESGDEENLMAMIYRIGQERKPGGQQPPAAPPAAAPAAQAAAPAAETPAEPESGAAAAVARMRANHPDPPATGPAAAPQAPATSGLITDPAWLADITAKIAAATTLQPARELYKEVSQGHADGKCTAADKDHLHGLINAIPVVKAAATRLAAKQAEGAPDQAAA